MINLENLTPRLIQCIPFQSLRERARARYRKHAADIQVISFPKSGRTWLRVMLSTYFYKKYHLLHYETIVFDNLHKHNSKIPKIFFHHDDDWSCSPNQLTPNKDQYRGSKIIFIARDPRDIIVSAYFHRTKRSKTNRVPSNTKTIDFVLGNKGGLKTVIAFYNIWARYLPIFSEALFITYEDMVNNTTNILRRVLAYMDQPVDESVLHEVINETTFSRMKAKERSGEYDRGPLQAIDIADDNSYKVRRGKVGGYRDYFSADELKIMDDLVATDLSSFYPYGKKSMKN